MLMLPILNFDTAFTEATEPIHGMNSKMKDSTIELMKMNLKLPRTIE
jgi:hypothetical protein